MSEAELHLIRARMRGGLLSKAKRGELVTPLPFGFAYDDAGRVVLDPTNKSSKQSAPYSKHSAGLVSVWSGKEFRKQNWQFPR